MVDFKADKKQFDKKQLIWLVLGIGAVLIIWLLSNLIYK